MWQRRQPPPTQPMTREDAEAELRFAFLRDPPDAAIPPLPIRAWRWAVALAIKSLPERRAYILCATRVMIGLGVLAVAPRFPEYARPTLVFFGNMFFYVGVFAVLAPFENGVISGVLDKAEALLFSKKAE